MSTDSTPSPPRAGSLIASSNGGFTLYRSWNATYMGNSPSRETFSLSASTTQWNYLIIQVKVHYDASQDPFVRVWQATGDGSLTKVVDRSGPVGYNEDTPTTAQKFGLYRWDSWAGDSQQTRTAYTKGLYIFKDTAGSPALNEQSMLALLRSI